MVGGDLCGGDRSFDWHCSMMLGLRASSEI